MNEICSSDIIQQGPIDKTHVQYIVDFIYLRVIHSETLVEKNMVYDIQGDEHNSTAKIINVGSEETLSGRSNPMQYLSRFKLKQ